MGSKNLIINIDNKIFNKFLLLIILIILNNFNLKSLTFPDLNNEPTIHIDLSDKKDATDDATDDINKETEDEYKDSYIDQSDDVPTLNEWYSKGNVFVMQSAKYGVLVNKNDFLSESFLFKYRFRSKSRHAFSLRVFHIGYTIDLLNGIFDFFNFGFFTGFEYLYKIFSNQSGIFVWTDFGACNRGPALNFGLGIGDRIKNGIEFEFTYLHNIAFLTKIEFYFLIIKVLTIRGILGVDIKHKDFNYIEQYAFLTGAYIGFLIKNIFRVEFGGGVTLDEFSNFGGFGSISFALNFF